MFNDMLRDVSRHDLSENEVVCVHNFILQISWVDPYLRISPNIETRLTHVACRLSNAAKEVNIGKLSLLSRRVQQRTKDELHIV